MSETVAKRAIFYIGGYDPKSANAFFQRIQKESKRYETTFDAKIEPKKASQLHEDITITQYESSGSIDGKKWKTHTDFHFLTLDDIVLKDFQRPFHIRFARSFVTTWNYLLTGTAFRFLRHAWRFFVYFAYPPMAVVLTAVIAVLIAAFFGAMVTKQFRDIVHVIVFALTTWIFVEVFWKKRFILHLMDLWSFSRDYLYQNRNDIELKLDRLADTATQTLKKGRYDEAVFIGHSTGAALILDVAARVRQRDADFASKAKHVSLLTVGSTALKIGLHPAAKWYRQRLNELFTKSKIGWYEYQCHSDVINFYKTDPAQLMNIDTNQFPDLRHRPVRRGIRIKHMVSEKVYDRMRRNPFRIHYQFVFGNTKPYHYDFIGVCFGPRSLKTRSQKEFVEGQ